MGRYALQPLGFVMLLAIGRVQGQECADSLPDNSRLTCQAWRLHGLQEFGKAIDSANLALAIISGDARDRQCLLAKEGRPEPPVGAVPDSIGQAIHGNGLINDVGTLWFIKGISFTASGAPEPAQGLLCSAWVSFQAARFYTYARTWDPRGWFWSPSEAAGTEMAKLAANPGFDSSVCKALPISCPSGLFHPSHRPGGARLTGESPGVPRWSYLLDGRTVPASERRTRRHSVLFRNPD